MPSKLADRSILIVEDEPIIALEIVQALQDAGAAVTTTNTLKQAIILVENDGLAAAILDHALGDGESTQLCARLKEHGIPFLIYSGFPSVDGACADGPLIEKPTPASVVLANLEALLPPEIDSGDSPNPQISN